MQKQSDATYERHDTIVPYSTSKQARGLTEYQMDRMPAKVLDNYRRGLFYYLHTCALLFKMNGSTQLGVEGIGLMYPWECIILFLFFPHTSKVYERVLRYFVLLHMHEMNQMYLQDTFLAAAKEVSDAIQPKLKKLDNLISECGRKNLVSGVDNAVVKFSGPGHYNSTGFVRLWRGYIAGDYVSNREVNFQKLSENLVTITSNLLVEQKPDESVVLFLQNGSQYESNYSNTSLAVVPIKKKDKTALVFTYSNYAIGFSTYTKFCSDECTRNGKNIEGLLPSVVLTLFACMSHYNKQYNHTLDEYIKWHKDEPDTMYMKDAIYKMMLMMRHAVGECETELDRHLDECSESTWNMYGIRASTLVTRFRSLLSSSRFYVYIFKAFVKEDRHIVKDTLERLYSMLNANVSRHDRKWSDK